MSRSRNDSFGEGEGIPIQNVEFTTSTTPEEEVDAAQSRWLLQQQQQQLHHQNNTMYHARNASGSSLDTEAAAEYWHQWQQYYAAYGYSYNPPAGYPGYAQQQQQQPQSQQAQSQQQQPQSFLIPPQNQQQYAPWPAQTTPNSYSVPVSLGSSKQQQSTSSHSQGSPFYPQSRKTSSSAPSSPKFGPRPPSSSQEHFAGSIPDGDAANDVYAALLQGVGPSYGATTQTAHHRKNSSRGSLPDSIGARSSTGSSKLFPQPPRRNNNQQDAPPSHQRSKSDSLFSLNNGKKQQPYHLQRSNTSGVPTDPLRRPRANSRSNSRSRGHRRTSSYASSGGVSVSSMVSIVSDIRKSTFYAPHHGTNDVTSKGRVQLHFPTSFVHLVPSRSRKLRLYQVPVSNEQYEAYHRVADESFSWIGDDEEGDDDEELNKDTIEVDMELLDFPSSSPPKQQQQTTKRKACTCHCPNCATCQHKMKSALDPSYFLLTVPDNLYRSVVDEICAAREMPCGLFFCGHHEDVSRPSIGIAGAIVLLLFAAMAYAAYVLQA